MKSVTGRGLPKPTASPAPPLALGPGPSLGAGGGTAATLLMFARTLWGTNMGLEPTAVGAGPVEANVEAGVEAVEGCGAVPMVLGLGGPVVTVGAGARGLGPASG